MGATIGAAIGGKVCICSLDYVITTFLLDNECILHVQHKVFSYFVLTLDRLFRVLNRVYQRFRGQLSLDDGLIFKGNRL